MSWAALDDELAVWRREGRDLPVWWRDDDAVAMTPALERLLEMSDRLGIVVHLAMVPAEAEALGEGQYRALVHGWGHVNHAPPEEKKAEFRGHRPLAVRLDEAKRGLARVQALFGARACAVFVPPWNRIAGDMGPGLAALGYRGLSAFGPRGAAVPGLVQVNTHLDPIDWRGNRSLVEEDVLLALVVRQLGELRRGEVDAGEPYGVLTHHLVHDAPIWEFSARLLAVLLEGGARAVDLKTEGMG
ncbi:MAG: polysaccharide deacetylase family protein [Pseudooceanicola sp.]|nr:polysaccharide deacetylase family protein [Pseudooceanicola sp.]